MTTDKNLPDEFWENAEVQQPEKPAMFTVHMNAQQFRRYSAADDLLEALIALVDKSMDIRGVDFEFYAINELSSARAAIAKAKGVAG